MRCIDRAVGHDWTTKYDIELAQNRWGAVEPRADDMAHAPQVIQMIDMRCRREVSLDRQPRPE
ncbi:MAG: hypothetical protein EOO27_39775 [Comamonadaceae bacterium]|nr:MAG: hypothetical protein EOO27_39775 [Comamonadaceae bacterium]